MNLTTCSKCGKEVEITLPGTYSDMLSCGHIIVKLSSTGTLAKGSNAVESASIAETLKKTSELPKINGNDLIQRALESSSQGYEDFFNAENPIIDDVIKEHGRDNAVLVFTAIHAHLSKSLFALNRFRNIYYIRIEALRKEIEDKAVKELIQNHDFHFDPSSLIKPKKVKSTGTKTGTDIDKAKIGLSGLTDKDGKPVDVMKLMGSLMWKGDSKKELEKKEYQEGLDKIKGELNSDSKNSKEKEKE